MTIYWLLFAYASVMAMLSATGRMETLNARQALALLGFLVLYGLVAALRYRTGGDWANYDQMFEDVRYSSLGEAVAYTDPGFGLLLWLSAQLGLGIYLPNAVCAALLCYGVVRIAIGTRDPWLGLVAAVPYLLIVVGLGYVRQAGAIGMLLLAVPLLDRGRPGRTVVYLVLAASLHSTAAILFPFFGYVMATRNKVLAIILSLSGAAGLLLVLLPRLQEFEAGYIEAEFSSTGAAVRVVMNVVPSILFLLRRRALELSDRALSLWTLVALANLLAGLALLISPSSTAVDRIALYFSIIQIFAFGQIRPLTGFSDRNAYLLRLLVIGFSALVQTVWLVFAVHSEFWVPYQSVLQFL